MASWWNRCTQWLKKHQSNSYSPFTGYFYFINFIIGTGFLSLPHVFYNAGIIAATLTLFFISMISCCTAIWIVESQSRAQALETYRSSPSKSLDKSEGKPEPDFEVTIARKFEQTEMCEIFYNRYVKWTYILIMTVYGFQGSWAYATVAASAWAANIPFNTSTLKMCQQYDFNKYFVPPDPGCANAYRLCVFLFGVVVVALSLVELTEQKIIQVTMGVMRFVTMVCMMIFCIVRLIESNGLPPHFENSTVTHCNASSSNATLGEAFYHFNFKPWLVGIPIFVYSQLTHMGIITLAGPMTPKKYFKQFFGFLMSSTFCIYSVLAIAVAMYFQYCVSDTASLNWLPWLELDGYVALKVLSYYIILFPSLDVISAYPLNNATIANNVYIIITGRDSTDDKRQYVKLFLLLLKFICAVLPLALAFAVSNLLYVVEYAGLLGFAICHLYPAMLQFASQYHCMKVFGGSTCSINASDEGAPLLGKAKKGNFLKNWWLTWKNPAYWTPHSTFISHPISVSIICVICLILFGLSVGSFFVPS